MFARKVSPREKILFKENYKNQGFSFDDVKFSLNYFSKDKYLKYTTTSINRVFEFERIQNVTYEVKENIAKNGWKTEYSKHLGDIKKLTKIFPKVGDIISWAREEPDQKPDSTRIYELIRTITTSNKQTQTLLKTWINLPQETKELGYKSVWTGSDLIGFLKKREVQNAL
ncbi:MAG: hypothetical protein CMP11_09070 [Zetaproteobacteria bacterium]|nr:hypothetical protein [Pseudobdellovibrionaceae bacterium]